MIINNNEYFDGISKIIKEGEKAELTIIGQSMEPLLRNNRDKVVLSKFKTERPKIGDIILFKYKNNYYLHRFIGILKTDNYSSDTLLVCKGDCSSAKEIISTSDIYGIATAIIRTSTIISTNSFYFKFLSFMSAGCLPALRKLIHLGKK